ncbi:MAG: mechanosensitive ion channel domain-containing protein, partial [Candidatus Woesearchaeota archaeon]
ILALAYAVVTLLYAFSLKSVVRHKDRQQRSILRKVVRIGYFLVLGIITIIVFGYELENVWFTIGGVLGLIAIGFIAVWSMLSNIIAAVIIFVSKPFMIDSHIKLIDSKTAGRVDEITLFHTIIQDAKGNYIHIPNNFFFQKEFVHVTHVSQRKKSVK